VGIPFSTVVISSTLLTPLEMLFVQSSPVLLDNQPNDGMDRIEGIESGTLQSLQWLMRVSILRSR
jgi:hypothetical protein